MRARSLVAKVMIIGLLVVFAGLSAWAAEMRTVTGKVIGVGPDGKGIAVEVMMGGKELVAGAVVTNETVVTIGGRKGSVMDIMPNDRVTLTYSVEEDNLYAKKVMKK